jgi:hypothetical protein
MEKSYSQKEMTMRKSAFCVSFFLSLIVNIAIAQQTDTTSVEEDFSQYADAELADGAKRFCTSKVFDQSPNKLISVGYDFQGGHDFSMQGFDQFPTTKLKVSNVQGLRIAGNFPVISKTNILVNLGVSFWESRYTIDQSEQNIITNTLATRGLHTTGVSATVFKPLNEKNFLLLQANADLNGDYLLPDFQSLSLLRYSATVVYGWKKHDRLLYGFGVSRTYRIGEPNYIPVFMYNYTFPSRKWGVEAAFPARGQLRRSFNTRTLAFFGYELEGQTYRLASIREITGIGDPELRRSELRLRFTFERSLKDFIWVSVQAGLRYNWSFNVDDKDIFRGFTGTQVYAIENTLSNALYFNISINLVSP